LTLADGSHGFYVPDEKDLLLVKLNDLLYLEAEESQTRLHFVNGEEMLASHSLKYWSTPLEQLGFVRIHNSYTINRLHMKKYVQGRGGHVVLPGDFSLPVSMKYKHGLTKHESPQAGSPLPECQTMLCNDIVMHYESTVTYPDIKVVFR
jgi:DNA-binding LytR/AlgR family response regulator